MLASESVIPTLFVFQLQEDLWHNYLVLTGYSRALDVLDSGLVKFRMIVLLICWP